MLGFEDGPREARAERSRADTFRPQPGCWSVDPLGHQPIVRVEGLHEVVHLDGLSFKLGDARRPEPAFGRPLKLRPQRHASVTVPPCRGNVLAEHVKVFLTSLQRGQAVPALPFHHIPRLHLVAAPRATM